jgi:hypothetical protein
MAQLGFNKCLGPGRFYRGNACQHVRWRSDWIGYLDSDTARHGHFNIERLRNDENVAKQNGRVEIVPSHGLHGAFGDGFGIVE